MKDESYCNKKIKSIRKDNKIKKEKKQPKHLQAAVTRWKNNEN